jgi:hypothetical protein
MYENFIWKLIKIHSLKALFWDKIQLYDSNVIVLIF